MFKNGFDRKDVIFLIVALKHFELQPVNFIAN